MFEHKTKLRQMIEEAGDKCLAIGECGLDYTKNGYYDGANIEFMQMEMLKHHFDLAKQYRLPMLFIVKNADKDF